MKLLSLLNEHHVLFKKHRQAYESHDELSIYISDSFMQKESASKAITVLSMLYKKYGTAVFELKDVYKNSVDFSILEGLARVEHKDLTVNEFLFYINALDENAKFNKNIDQLFRNLSWGGKKLPTELPPGFSDYEQERYMLLLAFSQVQYANKSISWESVEKFFNTQSSNFIDICKILFKHASFYSTDNHPIPYDRIIPSITLESTTRFAYTEFKAWLPLVLKHDAAWLAREFERNIALTSYVLRNTNDYDTLITRVIVKISKDDPNFLTEQFFRLLTDDRHIMMTKIPTKHMLRAMLPTVVSDRHSSRSKEIIKIFQQKNIDLASILVLYDQGIIEQSKNVNGVNAILSFVAKTLKEDLTFTEYTIL